MADSDFTRRPRIADDDWILGSRSASVVLLEYGDFECPYCAAARPVLEGLVADYPDVVCLAFRHFPITTTHPHTLQAAEAAEAAGAQGKFWEMHDMLFTHQRKLELEHLRWYAEVIGLDLARFDSELFEHAHRLEIQRDFRRGVREGVNGTPTLFIDGFRYDGPRTREALLAAISQAVPGFEPVSPAAPY